MTEARAAWLAFALSIAVAHADAPTLDVLYPPGGARGSTNTVTVTGKSEPWPPKVWVSAPGLTFEAQTNKGKFTVTVAADATAGPRLIRLYNDEGASEARFFVVGETNEATDTEPNNHFARPQKVELPLTISGRLEKGGDVDSFVIGVRAGQWLDARIDSHTIMSKVDAVLRLVTTNGTQIGWNHDFATLDPRIAWRATNDESVVLQVYGFPHPATAAVKLHGSDSAIYRLHVSTHDASPIRECSPAQHGTNVLELPATVHAAIPESASEQRHLFAAKKDEYFLLKVGAAVAGSPLDAFLKVEDAAGKELARNDDAEGTRDPSLEWKATGDGAFHAVVGSLTHRGGRDYHYSLTVERGLPDYRATLSANSLVVKADSTNSLKLNVKRLRGYTNELVARVHGLPEGVSASATNVQSGDVTLQVIAATNAPAFGGPIRLLLTDSITKEERAATFPLTSRTEDNGVPGGYSDLLIDSLDHVWVTVRPAPAEAPKK